METKTYEIVDSVEALHGAIARVRAAQKVFATYTQEQVDKIFLAAASAADKARISLAKLAVEEAIRRTDSTVGTVSGKIIGEDAAEIVYNEKSYTLFSDGTYSFVSPASSGTATVLDSLGNTLGEFEINIVSGTEISAGEYIINPEPDTEPEIPETTQSDI